MARTKASVGAKVAVGKSSKARCNVAPPPSTPSTSGTSDRASRSSSGGNPVCPRETPKWQKPITRFFASKDSDHGSTDEEDIVRKKPKNNTIESDDEENETPTNQVLDETLELEPLTGENSHKIDEYYTNNNDVNGDGHEKKTLEESTKSLKGKGKGKKTKGKENLDYNSDRKRYRDEKDANEENAAKKIKVD